MTEDLSRVIDPIDQSVRPSRDTGFRHTEVPSAPYIRRVMPADPHLFLECIHNDDMVDIGPGTLRGQILDSVRVYKVDYEKVEQRLTNDIRRNITIRVIKEHGDSPCLCQPIPGSVPRTDCGEGC